MGAHILAIDIGNTRTKVAWFEGELRREVWMLETQRLDTELEKLLLLVPREINLKVGWISVAAPVAIDSLACWTYFARTPVFVPIPSVRDLPIRHVYETPETLGTDRIVGVIAARALAPALPVLVIDAGTAITYDYADASGIYQGGGISPGISMRFRALQAFTARLPLVEIEENIPLIGNTTHRSIRSGVIHGAVAEVDGLIGQYRDLAGPSLQVVLTGGDILTFENRLKNVNFADPYLLLIGIRLILNQISTS